jgi:Peptidase inhibitor I78 family
MKLAATLLLVFSVTACASPPPAVVAPADPNAALPAPSDDTCGASMYGELIGKPIDGPGVPGESRLNRLIRPGTQVTMDYVAQRMNIEANAQGVIQKINCG